MGQGSGSCFLSGSAASSRPDTPTSLVVTQLQPSRFSRAASAAVAQTSSVLGCEPLRPAASLPPPAWQGAPAAGEAAPSAAEASACGSTPGGPVQPPSAAALRCCSTVSLSGWQPPQQQLEQPPCLLQPLKPLQHQPQLQCGTGNGSDTLPTATAWTAEYQAAEAAASPAAPASQQQQQPICPQAQCAPLSGAVSGTVTPRLGSLSALRPVLGEGSAQVTPRAQALRGMASVQVRVLRCWRGRACRSGSSASHSPSLSRCRCRRGPTAQRGAPRVCSAWRRCGRLLRRRPPAWTACLWARATTRSTLRRALVRPSSSAVSVVGGQAET